MSELNADQQEVVDERQGPRSVIAGPGTGKTTTMVALIDELINDGVYPHEIRAVTFSKEMAEALGKRVPKGIVSTFHSLGYLICNEVERKPVEPELRHRLMMKLIRKWDIEYKDLDLFISRMRREDVSPTECTECGDFDYGFACAYSEYERVRADEGWMDFDSMLHDSVQYLESTQFRARWQYKYLIVDEAQDTDDLQWRMMQRLSEKHGNITVVGDPNQAIYGFRGAKPENITNFEQWFPGGRKYYLGINYRSTRNIVNFIRENAPKDTPQELLDKMVAFRKEDGKKIAMKMYWTDDAEAESALKLASADPLNSAILARTNRMVGLLERLCNRYGVRYHLLGKTGYWKQNEIRKAIEALKDYPNLSAAAACNLALPHLESKYAVADRTERDNDALENLAVLRTIAKEHNTAKDFVVYGNKMMHRRNDARGITISTIHQAKGSEWDNVYLIGANAKMIPHKNGDPLEEARIYLVGISRPRNFLRISFSGTPSSYLRKYLTEEILDKLTACADDVQSLQSQHKLFEEKS